MTWVPADRAAHHATWFACIAFALVFLGVPAPARGATLTVKAGDNLQVALDFARPGDLILLEAGATFVGNFVLAEKQGTEYITVRSSADPGLMPRPGTRLTPDYAGLLPKIATPNAAPALQAGRDAHHWRFQWVQFVTAPDGSTYNLVSLGYGDSSQTRLDQVPHDLVFDQILIDIPPTVAMRRCVALNSASTTLINSYVAGCKAADTDSQAVWGWNGPGPFLIENNYLEGAAENIGFGGAVSAISGLIPSDITIRRNHIAKPLTWKPTDPSYAGRHWLVKNLMEFKAGRRVRIEGNVLEYSWADGQIGWAVLFTVRDDNTWNIIEDLTFQNNVVRHAGNGIAILGLQPGYSTQGTWRITIRNNVFYDIDRTRFGGDGLWFGLYHDHRNTTIDHNTAVFNPTNFIMLDNEAAKAHDFTFTNNLLQNGDYGFNSSLGEGARTIDALLLGATTFAKNVLATDDPHVVGYYGTWAAANYFPSIAAFRASFSDPAGNDYRLVAASPYRGAGTDGRDIGADIDTINAAVAGVATSSPQPKGPRNIKVIR
jgi:hypothetical protein